MHGSSVFHCLTVALVTLTSVAQANQATYPKEVTARGKRGVSASHELIGRNGGGSATISNSSMQSDLVVQSLFSSICTGQPDNTKLCASRVSVFVCNKNGIIETQLCPSGYVCCHATNACNPDNTCSTNSNSVIPEAPAIPVYTNASQLGVPAPPSVVTAAGFCKQNGNKPMRMGYITSWGQYASDGCRLLPSKINPKKWSHLLYSFGAISGNSVVLDVNADLPYVQALRAQGIKVILSVGGWGAAQEFVTMAATDAGRKQFSQSVLDIFDQYGFDGVDLDWEFPSSYKDSNGNVIAGSEGDNLGNLITTLRYYFKQTNKKYFLSLAVPTIPTVYNYPLDIMAKYCDFVNVMTYDLHGPWEDTANPNTDNQIIKDTFDSLVNYAKFPRHKLNLGLAFYGRTYKLSDPGSCNGVGCPFIKDGNPYAGTCAQSNGYVHMVDLLKMRRNGAVAQSDAASGTSWLITSDGSWVTFDAWADFKRKEAYAKSMCLGGTFVWAVDQDPDQVYVYW
ncbi:UNVERIFIED_CONTAM: hypothetical protein HDU68_004691 [Siphonaria sp. JEL0065]|nr:hypothetical protein HDU68_004691 [Siphonaria sp. JEL0065]